MIVGATIRGGSFEMVCNGDEDGINGRDTGVMVDWEEGRSAEGMSFGG